MTTLLTEPLTEEQQKQFKVDEKRLTQAESVALGIWLQAYRAGDANLQRLVNVVHKVLIQIGIPEGSRHRVLGKMIDEALMGPQPTKRVGGASKYPVSLKKTAASLIELVIANENLPKSRDSNHQTAFTRTAEILGNCGFEVSESTLIKWYSEFR